MLHADRHAHSSGRLVADNVLWLTGALVNSGQLVDAQDNPISAAIAPQIFRTDWQGRQLLYRTARTNYILYSDAVGGTDWTAQSGVVVTLNALTAPDGTLTASLIDLTSAGVGSGIFEGNTGPFSTNTKSVWLRGYSGGEIVTLKDPSVRSVKLTNPQFNDDISAIFAVRERRSINERWPLDS